MQGIVTLRRARGPLRLIWFCCMVLAVLIGALGPGANPAFAIPPDPIDPPPLRTDPFELPENGFNWSRPSRFGVPMVRDGHTMVNFYWDADAIRYEPDYVHPKQSPLGFPVDFDGCQTQEEQNGRPLTHTYTWVIAGQTLSEHGCQFRYSFRDEGAYPVILTITAPQQEPQVYEQTVKVKDYLIVSIGDSYAAGEGSPDVPQVVIDDIVVEKTRWQDKRCHRSALSGPARAAAAIEARDPHSSVTFLSFACAGATISRESFQDDDIGKPRGTGILGPYVGAEPPDNVRFNGAFEGYLKSQIQQLKEAIGDRQIDALMISGGGNDAYFFEVGKTCVAEPFCWAALALESPRSGALRPLEVLVDTALAGLPGKYIELNNALAELNIATYSVDGASRKGIFITEYPDPTNAGNCDKILDDILVGKHVIDAEVEWGYHEVVVPLNQAIERAANTHSWIYVDQIASQFADHGYCADDHWIRRAPEAVVRQGPYPLLLPKSFCAIPVNWEACAINSAVQWTVAKTKTSGMLHPTERGYEEIATYLSAKISSFLFPPAATPAPTFTIANTSGSLTSTEGENGFLVGSCQGQTCSADQAVLTVEAFDPSAIRGAGVSVDSIAACPELGVPHSPMTGVTCTKQKLSEQRVRWSFTFTGDGMYHLSFTAQNKWRQFGTLAHEVRVDLRQPNALLLGIDGAAGENNWYRSPVQANFSGIDAPGGFGVTRINYRIGSGEIVNVLPGDKAPINADGYHSLSYQAVDYAGHPSAWQTLLLKIDTITPTATLVAPTAPVDEGSAFTLALANPSDAPNGDPAGPGFSYAFDCGAGYGGWGTSSSASCAAADSGPRTVKAKIKDKAGNVGEYSAAVTIAGVPPTAAFTAPTVAVNEGSLFTLKLENPTDPSSADRQAGFSYAFDCGAGYGAFSASTSANCTPTDNGALSVKGKIKDKDGDAREYSAGVTVNNVAPTATFRVPAPVAEGSPYTLALETVSDASGDLPSLEYAFDCGGGYGLWSQNATADCPTSDSGEPAVKGKIRDKDGGVREYTARATVYNVAPTATLVAPESAVEGLSFALKLENPADPSSADTAAGFRYAFDCGDGYGAFGADNTASCAIDSGNRTVKGQIKDKNDGTTEYSATVAVSNVAPTASFGAPEWKFEGSGFNLTLRDPVDVPADLPGLKYAFDCGDGAGYGAFGASNMANCSIDDDGTVVVKGQVKDKDDGVTEYSAEVAIRARAPVAIFQVPASVIKRRTIRLELAGAVDGPADLARLQYAFDCGDGAGYSAFGPIASASCPTSHSGARTVKGKVQDEDGLVSEYSAEVTIVEPLALTITAPSAGATFAVNSVVNLAAAFTDAELDDAHACRISWDNGSELHDGVVTHGIGSGTCAASHTYTTPGEYRIKVSVANEHGDGATATVMIVITPPKGK